MPDPANRQSRRPEHRDDGAKGNRRGIWSLTAGSLTVGGGGSWWIYLLITRSDPTSSHSGTLGLMGYIAAIIAVLAGGLVLVGRLVRVLQEWQAGRRLIKKTSSHREAMQTYQLVTGRRLRDAFADEDGDDAAAEPDRPPAGDVSVDDG